MGVLESTATDAGSLSWRLKRTTARALLCSGAAYTYTRTMDVTKCLLQHHAIMESFSSFEYQIYSDQAATFLVALHCQESTLACLVRD